jgi:hypothetical protein
LKLRVRAVRTLADYARQRIQTARNQLLPRFLV